MRAARLEDEEPLLPLTSLIDVVFLLLVFFLAATNFTRKELDQQVQLPRSGRPEDAAVPAPESLVINIRADGVLVVNGRVQDVDGLRETARSWRAARLAAGLPSRAAIRGDGRAPYETVMRVLGLCRREGIVEVDLPVLEDDGIASL